MTKRAIIIGGGPAGLMAAEALLNADIKVDLYDAMPSIGRKFLMAGRGGLNITHSEPMHRFLTNYGVAQDRVAEWLNKFSPQHLRDWVHNLGIDTFIGTSGRVFPKDMKAAPLLRAWLSRLRSKGLHIHVRHRWIGWSHDNNLIFATAKGDITTRSDVTILALGGASWPKLGSDGAWQDTLREKNIDLTPLEPANCGFDIVWSDYLKEHFAGAALKNIAATFEGMTQQGEAIVTTHGIEGGLIYTLSASLRSEIMQNGQAILKIDLLPIHGVTDIANKLAMRGSRSLSSHLKSSLGLSKIKIALIQECLEARERNDPAILAMKVKALPLFLKSPRPITEAISTAGGIKLAALDDNLMVKSHPGLFCAGEMLDWEAPTGGYLLTACFASGYAAGKGAAKWLSA